jgi:hypothetical protein
MYPPDIVALEKLVKIELFHRGSNSMADSSLMPALIGLGGTVIGFAGGFISQWLLEGRKQRAENKKRRRRS